MGNREKRTFGRIRIGILVCPMLLSILQSFLLPINLQADERFKVYGFIDAGAGLIEPKENHPALGFFRQGFNFGVEHLNLYFDFKPNERTRALAELSYGDDIIVSHWRPGLEFEPIRIDGIPYTELSESFRNSLQEIQDNLNAQSYLPDTARSHSVKLIRAQMDFRMNELLTLRAGRFITPAGIWNVDHGSPVLITIGYPYQSSLLPLFPLWQEGLMLMGGTFIDDIEINYNLFGSTGWRDNDLDNKETYPFRTIDSWKHMGAGGHTEVSFEKLQGITVGVSGYAGGDHRTETYAVATIDRPSSKLISLISADSSQQESMARDLFTPYMDEITFRNRVRQLKHHYVAGIDAKASYANFTLQGEINHREVDNEMTGGVNEFFGFYALLNYLYSVNNWLSLTPYFMFEHLDWTDPTSDPTLIQLPFDSWNSYIGGLNLCLWGNARFKAEYRYNQMGLEKPVRIKHRYSEVDLSLGYWVGQFSLAF